jgi:signal transduction histidine kinase
MHYPWLSLLLALLLLAWQYLMLNPGLLQPGYLPVQLERAEFLPYAAALLVLIAVFDFRLFVRAQRRHRDQLERYQQQIDELFDSKRQLGTRARAYSGHADKLKMFISERLLEYIEYDEKFLHFKNIASEVRHNGVISYDKAQTALKQALQQCEGEQQAVYREAADALLYLWDLLDLSTTDNIALHVANRIYDCEEHYFQAQLNPEESQSSPLRPTFSMSQAIRRALLPIAADATALGLNTEWCEGREYADEQFRILLRGDSEMLGNVNHMVLLIENLVNNALFYAQQKASSQRHNRVAIRLAQSKGEVRLGVYNRGPHIDDDEKEKIYQLGFSSRRVREHHGKGLGLYFVHQIVHGFEGSIGFDNIRNRVDRISLNVKLSNGELLQQQIGIVDIDGRPMCELVESEAEVSKRHEWNYPAPITSIEISSGEVDQPQLIAGVASGEETSYFDSSDPMRARWLLDIRNRKRSARLVFMPLDVRGVEFMVRLPTAGSRLDNQE